MANSTNSVNTSGQVKNPPNPVGRPANQDAEAEMIKPVVPYPDSDAGDAGVVQDIFDQIIHPVSPGDEFQAREDYTMTRFRNYLATLPFAVDGIDEVLDYETKSRMLCDPIISGNINYLVMDALDTEIDFRPFVQDKTHPDYADAIKVYDLHQRAMEPIEDQLYSTCYDMAFNALGYGHCSADKVAPMAPSYSKDPGKRYFGSFKTLSYDSFCYLVDAHMNVVGIAQRSATGVDKFGKVTIPDGDIADMVDVLDVPNGGTRLPLGWRFYPRAKYALMCNRPRHSDPRGTSLLRSIYHEWYMIQSIWPQYHQYLLRFAMPSVVGKTPPGPQQTRASGGGSAPLSAVQKLFKDLQKFQNASIYALPFGGELDLVFSQGEGGAFLAAISLFERRITKGITNQILASSESKNMARAASETHQDHENVAVRYVRRMIGQMIRRDLSRYITRINLGPRYERLAPVTNYCAIAPEDMAEMLSAVTGGYATGYFDNSQLRGLDAMMGLPYRAVPEPGFYPGGSMNQKALDHSGDPPPSPKIAAPSKPDAGPGAKPVPAKK